MPFNLPKNSNCAMEIIVWAFLVRAVRWQRSIAKSWAVYIEYPSHSTTPDAMGYEVPPGEDDPIALRKGERQTVEKKKGTAYHYSSVLYLCLLTSPRGRGTGKAHPSHWLDGKQIASGKSSSLAKSIKVQIQMWA